LPRGFFFPLICISIIKLFFLVQIVVLHCRLYALRQRIRMDALARGADVLPNGTIRMRKVTMNKVALEDLPIRVYSSTPALEAGAGTSAGAGTDKEKAISTAAATAEASSSSSSAEASGSNTHKASTSLSRNNSKGSISSKSIRSLKAIESATALDAAAAADTIQQNPMPQPASAVAHGLDDISSDTCAVCLDEFSDGEELRTLPCHHEFHVECIGKFETDR
jgi:DNA polymerase III gamma/tau subunit